MSFPELPDEAMEPGVSFHFEGVSFEIESEQAVSDWLADICEFEKKPLGEVNFIFLDDEGLHKINLEHLAHDDYTDVITFPYSERKIEGDVFISSDRVRENAAMVGTSFQHELCRVMVHGMLHLAGHSDKSAELRAAMAVKEDFHLSRLFQQKGPTC